MRIHKMRREWFGGVVYSENPGFTAFVDSRRADALGIQDLGDLTTGLFSAPLDVHLSITERCNLHCRGCYACDCGSAGNDMSLELSKDLIDRLAEMNVLTIAIGGGEPFHHPHLFDIAQYARNKGIVPNVTTNGLTMDEDTAMRCRVFGSVHVSCHHPSELPRLVQCVRALKRARINVGLNVLVSSATYTELPLIWHWCARQGISQLLILKFKIGEHNEDCRDLLLSQSQERSLLPLIRRLSRRYSIMPILDCSLFPALAYHNPKKRDLEFFDVNGCLGGNAILAITATGEYKPCSFWRTSYGDARSLNRETWKQNEKLAAFRTMRRYSTCGQCAYGDLCNGGCRASETQCCRTLGSVQ